ncbi:DUF1304-domain-containing protein [Melanomma pulvis-pyrius CBS 109.77]|uniref:DUF1304-domain-containing protein n=1 Tax=Melanomma pulvis-pyrius CBS 109.77 TaxID=1314802 RepID=A0A6A6X144_9PLEO|nr:DUF1304-domain-containing protein [Melanomma pulvis-pyrius CBS 109.77]
MPLLSTLPVALVATIHTYIFALESLMWTTPRGHKTFGMTPAYAAQTKVLALNQGLYNGFLAAGLVWGILHPQAEIGRQINLFFLGCVGVAGVVGGLTVKSKIIAVQTVPALLAIAGVLLA